MNSELMWFLQEQRHIFMVCPCCDEVIRLSDARISYQRTYRDDWLDKCERAEEAVERNVESFEERESEVRRLAIERARRRVLPQLLRKVAPALSRLKVSPMDVKTLLDPVGYVAFDGLNSSRGTRRIVFLDTPAVDDSKKRMHAEVESTIDRGLVYWSTIRIGREGSVVNEDGGRAPG